MTNALRSALVLFAIMFAHTVLETARDAMLLAKLGPGVLAWVYLAMAGLALVAYVALGAFARHVEPRRMLLGFLVVAASGTGVLAVFLPQFPWLAFVLYMWTGLVATMVVPTFWTLLDRALAVGDAKKMFAMIGAGGVVGAIAGAGFAGIQGAETGRTLMTVAAIGYACAGVLVVVLAPKAKPEPQPSASLSMSFTKERATASQQIPPAEAIDPKQRRYLRVLIALGVASTIGLTLGDLVFKRALAERFSADELAHAFGAIYAGLNVLGLAIQVLVTPRLLSRWGVGGALVVLPLIMAGSSFGFALTGATLAIVALKLGDGSLRYSLHRVGTELLFLPVPADLRDRSKPIVDAIGLRGGQAVAALIALGLAWLGATSRTGAFVAGAISAAWLLGAIIARRAYVDAFRGSLRAREIVRDVRVPVPDEAALAVLGESLASPDETEAVAALDVLARHHRVPALVLYHPRPAVVLRALALLEGELRPDVARVLGVLLDHPDAGVRAAALAAASRTGTHRTRLVSALDDAEPAVRAVAAVQLSADTDAALAARASDAVEALAGGTEDDRLALAQAIGHAPHERFRARLLALLGRPEPKVARQVLRLYAWEPKLAEPERMLALLADPHVRGDARRALVAAGDRALALVTAALDDPRTPVDVRRQLPRTLANIHTEEAAAVLVARLLREPDGTTEFKILRALGRMSEREPRLRIEPEPILQYVQRAIADAARYATFADLAETGPHDDRPATALLATLLDEKRWSAIERAFRALGVLDPEADLRSVHDALVSGDPHRASAGEEVLDALVSAEQRMPLLAAMKPMTSDARRAALGPLAPGPFETYEAFAGALLADPSESVRCIVAHHIAEEKLVRLRKELVRLRPLAGTPLVTSAFDQAIARLDA